MAKNEDVGRCPRNEFKGHEQPQVFVRQILDVFDSKVS